MNFLVLNDSDAKRYIPLQAIVMIEPLGDYGCTLHLSSGATIKCTGVTPRQILQKIHEVEKETSL